MRIVVIAMVILAIIAIFAYFAIDDDDPTKDPDFRSSSTGPVAEPEPGIRSIPQGTNEQTLIPLSTSTPQTVSNEEDATAVFLDYVATNYENWDHISTEFYKEIDGVDHYQITYRHYEISGGKRRLLINEQGDVFDQVGLI